MRREKSRSLPMMTVRGRLPGILGPVLFPAASAAQLRPLTLRDLSNPDKTAPGKLLARGRPPTSGGHRGRRHDALVHGPCHSHPL